MDQTCPRCKTTKYRNPNMKLMVNVCGHNLCENCVELLFVKGSGACPECDIPLRRTNYRVQLFENSQIDKEVDIRRRILKDFNRKQEDFQTLRDFNDYLETIEDIIFNLTNNIDILETNKRILAYKEKNKEEIIKNRSRYSRDALEIEDIIATEQKNMNVKRRELQVIEEAEKAAKLRNKEKLIDDLMFGEGDATKILSDHRETVKLEESRMKTFSTGEVTGKSLQVPVTVVEEQPFVYDAPVMVLRGPEPPNKAMLHDDGYIRHIRSAAQPERAGGYVESLGCLRAVQEAMAGLYFVPGHVADRWSE